MNKLIFSSLAALVLGATSPASAAPQDFGQGTQIGRYPAGPSLDRDGSKAYRAFRKKARYFGAFAANANTGDVFYIFNFHDLKTARAAALEGCRLISQASGCAILAVALPENLPIDTVSASGLGEEAADAMNTVYREQRVPGKYAAFAISGAGNYGFANAWDTADYAKDTALAYCERGVARDMVDIGPMGRDWVRARGMNTCRIVHLEQEPAN